MTHKIPNTNLWAEDISYEDRVVWLKQNQHICINPYTASYSQVNNKLKIQTTCCCNLTPTVTDDEKFSAIRNTVEKGVKNSRCQICYDSEEQIGSSERTMSIVSAPPALINEWLTTGNALQYEFRIKFSNLCNLACKTCQPEFSSKYAQVYGIKVLKSIREDIGNDENFWNTLTIAIAKKCEEARYVSVALLGGESLIQPGAIRLINWLVETDLSKQIALRLTTNFTNLKDTIIKNFDKFQSVSICASIDSIGENYSYIRYPETFETIKSNLPQVLTDKIYLSITPVWSLHNVFYLKEYLDWWHTWFTDHGRNNIAINNVSMSNPYLMTIQNLPVEYRNNLLDIITQSIDHPLFENTIHNQFFEYLKGLSDFLASDNIVYNKFDEFLEQTAKDDVFTNKHMSTGNAKLYNILTDSHKQHYLEYINQYS